LSDEELIEVFDSTEGVAPGAADRLGAGTPGWSESDLDWEPLLHPAMAIAAKAAAVIHRRVRVDRIRSISGATQHLALPCSVVR
jgi:hypothetical protein